MSWSCILTFNVKLYFVRWRKAMFFLLFYSDESELKSLLELRGKFPQPKCRWAVRFVLMRSPVLAVSLVVACGWKGGRVTLVLPLSAEQTDRQAVGLQTPRLSSSSSSGGQERTGAGRTLLPQLLLQAVFVPLIWKHHAVLLGPES